MRAFWTILISFVIAMALAILPLPMWIKLLWPDWVVLVLIYWGMVMPHRINIGYAWLVGLLLDVLFGSVLGEHALALVCVAYFVAKFNIRIRILSMSQQMLLIFIVLILYRVVIFWLQGMVGDLPSSLLYWLPTITSAFAWPWVCMLLQDFDRRLKISGTQ